MPTFSKPFLIGIIAMAGIVVLSNILVQHLLGNWLTWAAFTYPLAFLVNDITNRTLGVAKARQVVGVGFMVGVLCSLIASQLIDAEGNALTTLRIAIGSGLAFLVAQLVDVYIFNQLRTGVWWRAPLVSSFIGSVLDTAIFFSIAFSATFAFIDLSDPNSWALEAVPLLGTGPVLPLWVSLAVADFLIKITMTLITLIPFRLLTVKSA